MNAIIYCRVSSREQIEGTSLGSQRSACEDYARAKSINILRVFVEEGESAKFADRTQLLELIEFCRKNKGRVQSLIVWKVDRFARNVADHFHVKATLTKYGVQIISVTEPIDGNPEGKLMETILAGFAQFDNDIRAMRTVQGMRRKLQEGIFPWAPPLGYRSTNIHREKKNAPDLPDTPLFGLLRKAWKEFATGGYTKSDIRRLLDTWGATTKRGRPLSLQALHKLFQNPYYAGILVDPWSGEEHTGKHEPMISREEFARVQQINATRRRFKARQEHRTELPLRGLVRCKGCHHHLTGGLSRGRSQYYAYYNCGNTACQFRGKSVPAREVHDEFERHLESIEIKTSLLDTLAHMIVKHADEREAIRKEKNMRSRATLDRLNKELQELIRMRAQGLIVDQEFAPQRTEVLERRNAIEAASLNRDHRLTDMPKILKDIQAALLDLTNTWQILSAALRRRFEKLILPVGFVIGSIRTAELGLLFNIFRSFSDHESTGVTSEILNSNQLYEELQEFSEILKAYQMEKEGSSGAVRSISRE